MELHWFLWWLGQHLLITTLLAGVVLVVCRAFRISPAARHVLWLLVLCRLLVPSVGTWAWPLPAGLLPANVPAPSSSTSGAATADSAMTEIGRPSAPTVAWDLTPTSKFDEPEHSNSLHAAAASSGDEQALSAVTWEVLALALWAVGSLIIATILLRRVLRIRPLLSAARNTDTWLQQEVIAWCRQFGVRAPVCVVSERVSSPFLWCLGRVRLVWPVALAQQQRHERARPILVHELAHLKRRDHWTAWIELAALVIWWWNPLLWFVRRQLKTASEMACDAWVVELLPDHRRAYAESLVEFSRRTRTNTQFTIGTVGADTGSRRAFEQRLELIMNGQFPARFSKRTMILGILLGLISLPAFSTEPETQATGTTPASSSQTDGTTTDDADGSPVAQVAASDAENAEQPESTVSLNEVLEQIADNYYGEVDRRELERAAIEAILSSLDANSQLLSREELNDARVAVEGELCGVGIAFQIDADTELPTVTHPIRHSPAQLAGIRSGDVIVSIDGESTNGLDLKEILDRIRGPRGSAVTLRIRNGDETRNVQILRDNLSISNVEPWLLPTTGAEDYWINQTAKVGYVRIPAFTKQTASQLRQVLADLSSEGISGLALDLRNCPGGLLTAATEVADMFIDDGVILTSHGRGDSDTLTFRATSDGTYLDLRLAVLVNGYTASAAEIVAACLQDHDRAAIVGEQTFGRGTVQSLFPLKDGGALKLTTAIWLRPDGRLLQRNEDDHNGGVTPNSRFRVQLNERERQRLEELQQRRAQGEAVEPDDDPQLKVALDWLELQAR
jgi:carboxyl-terminal processing protease